MWSEILQICKNKKVALLIHPASINANFQHLLHFCLQNGIQIGRIFGPEHGFDGSAQDMEGVNTKEHFQGIEIVSLYGLQKESLYLQARDLHDVDVLICDLQDIGARYYTFAYTIAFAMRACSHAQKTCIIVDRPNPIGAIKVEGNIVKDDFRSFVGEYPLANRHGMTLGELCGFFQSHDRLDLDMRILWMKNYRRHHSFEQSGLHFVYPSPNMPTLTTALLYPGACLLEGTNLSEGRGTTKPFELIGAPFIDANHFAKILNGLNLPGVYFRPCWFKPMFQKHAHRLCGAVQVHVLDQRLFNSMDVGVALIWAARQFNGFAWRTETYEFESERLAIDLLFGDDEPRKMLENSVHFSDVIQSWQDQQLAFAQERKRFLYEGYDAQS